jgi:hypothetical protein
VRWASFRRPPSPFEGWVEPELPADLPPGEARRTMRWTVWGGASPHPPATAPGFARALELGLLPAPTPDRPPAPLPGVRAQVLLWSGIALLFGSLVVFLLLLPRAPWTVVPVTGCWIAGFWLLGPGTERREQAELAAGYTTRGVHTGVWRLDRRGRVVREPDRTVAPPGFYPSPYFPGLLQRWDGPGWAPLPQRWRRHAHRYFRRPARPFLAPRHEG